MGQRRNGIPGSASSNQGVDSGRRRPSWGGDFRPIQDNRKTDPVRSHLRSRNWATPMARQENSSRAMSFRRAASILPPLNSSSCSTARLQNSQFPEQLHIPAILKGHSRRLSTCAGDYYLSSKQAGLPSASSNGLGKRILLPNSRRRVEPPAAISITKYYQYMGPPHLDPPLHGCQRGHIWLGLTSIILSGLYSQGVNNAVGESWGFPACNPEFRQTWGIPSVGFYGGISTTALATAPTVPYVTKDPNISVNDNITWLHGKHSHLLRFTSTSGRPLMSWATSSRVADSPTQANAHRSGQLSWEAGCEKPAPAFADFLLGQLYTSVYAVQIAQADYKRKRRSPPTSTITINSRPSSPCRPASAMS